MARSVRSASDRALRTATPRAPSFSATADIFASESCSWSRAPSTASDASATRVRSEAIANRARSPRPAASVTRSRASSTAAWISMRLGAAALPPRTQPGPNTSPSRVTAVTPSRTSPATASAAVDERHPLEESVDRRA